MKIRQVAQGAYFVQSYSEQTITPFQPAITSQTVITGGLEEEQMRTENNDVFNKDVFSKQDFEQALKKVGSKVKK